jgi:hypothetical protein
MTRSTWTYGCTLLLIIVGTPARAQTPVVPPPPAPEADGMLPWRYEVGATGETIFEHTRAGLRDPHFGMRFYYDEPIPGTLHTVANPGPNSDPAAATPDGTHFFWDVSFGESMPVLTAYKVDPDHARYAGGFQWNIDAAVFMLLDFSSQSAGVIDSDFRIGTSFDYRPWQRFWQHLSLQVGFFHESTHLGDEYVLSSGTIQGTTPPAANMFLPYRANPSYESLPVTLSVDWHFSREVSGRVYGGASKYFWSELPNEDFPSEWRVGGELRWTSLADGLTSPEATLPKDSDSLLKRAARNVLRRSTGLHPGEAMDGNRDRRGPFGVELAYELLARRQYNHDNTMPRGNAFLPGHGFWYVQHATAIALYNLDTARSASNAVGLTFDWIQGRSPFGQLTQYAHVQTLAFGLVYYW